MSEQSLLKAFVEETQVTTSDTGNTLFEHFIPQEISALDIEAFAAQLITMASEDKGKTQVYIQVHRVTLVEKVSQAGKSNGSIDQKICLLKILSYLRS